MAESFERNVVIVFIPLVNVSLCCAAEFRLILKYLQPNLILDLCHRWGVLCTWILMTDWCCGCKVIYVSGDFLLFFQVGKMAAGWENLHVEILLAGRLAKYQVELGLQESMISPPDWLKISTINQPYNCVVWQGNNQYNIYLRTWVERVLEMWAQVQCTDTPWYAVSDPWSPTY